MKNIRNIKNNNIIENKPCLIITTDVLSIYYNCATANVKFC